jgi:hypothetical protein
MDRRLDFHTNRLVIQTRETVAVAPTLTVLMPPQQVATGCSAISVEIINDDLSQSVDAFFEKAEFSTGPWDQSEFDGLLGIQPGETKMTTVDVRFLENVRLTATASGAGCNVRVSTVLYQSSALM